jgi:hypothetical protein
MNEDQLSNEVLWHYEGLLNGDITEDVILGNLRYGKEDISFVSVYNKENEIRDTITRLKGQLTLGDIAQIAAAAAFFALGFMPIIGQVMDAIDIIQSIATGDIVGLGLSLIGIDEARNITRAISRLTSNAWSLAARFPSLNYRHMIEQLMSLQNDLDTRLKNLYDRVVNPYGQRASDGVLMADTPNNPRNPTSGAGNSGNNSGGASTKRPKLTFNQFIESHKNKFLGINLIYGNIPEGVPVEDYQNLALESKYILGMILANNGGWTLRMSLAIANVNRQTTLVIFLQTVSMKDLRELDRITNDIINMEGVSSFDRIVYSTPVISTNISDNNREFIEIPGIEVIHVQNRQHAEQWIIEEVVTNGYPMPIIGISNKGGPCKKTCRPLVDEYNVPYVYSTEGVGTKHIEYRSGE